MSSQSSASIPSSQATTVLLTPDFEQTPPLRSALGYRSIRPGLHNTGLQRRLFSPSPTLPTRSLSAVHLQTSRSEREDASLSASGEEGFFGTIFSESPRSLEGSQSRQSLIQRWGRMETPPGNQLAAIDLSILFATQSSSRSSQSSASEPQARRFRDTPSASQPAPMSRAQISIFSQIDTELPPEIRNGNNTSRGESEEVKFDQTEIPTLPTSSSRTEESKSSATESAWNLVRKRKR